MAADRGDFESLSACPSELVSSEVFRFLTDFGLDLLSLDFFVLVVVFADFAFDFFGFGSSLSSAGLLK